MYKAAGLKYKAAPVRRKYLNTKYAFMNPTEAESEDMAQ